MAKCSVCKNELEETFLDKIFGTYIKIDGKLKPICNLCQKKYGKELNAKIPPF